jgi:hypothetical protein
MCISLNPIDAKSTYITANKIGNKVVVSYSLITSKIDPSQNATNLINRLASRPVRLGDLHHETTFAWFLPIKDYTFNKIKILDLTTDDKKNIVNCFAPIEQAKRELDTKRRGFSFNSSEASSDVITLKDGSQVVRAANPSQILNELHNINPEFHQDFLITAKNAISKLHNTPLNFTACLVYLFKGSSDPSRDFLAYEVPHEQGVFWLPTTENNHRSLMFERSVSRDLSIVWGGDNPYHKGSKTYQSSNTINSIVPDNYYGMFDYKLTYPNGHFENAFIGIDFDDQDLNNIKYNIDSNALHQHPIFN